MALGVKVTFLVPLCRTFGVPASSHPEPAIEEIDDAVDRGGVHFGVGYLDDRGSLR
jgi:hypothetical protein